VKKPITLFLLLLLVLLSGMAPLRVGLRQAARIAMEHRMHRGSIKSPLVLIEAETISRSDWEGKSEFRKDGVLYDISGSVTIKGRQYYQCINDQLEERMERSADHISHAALGLKPGDSRNNTQSKIARSLMDWLQGLYYQPQANPSSTNLYMAGNKWLARPMLLVENPSLDVRIVPPEA
jgi:hypothetical protein